VNKTPTLTRIGAGQYDTFTKMTDLKFRLPKANRYYMKKLRTTDKTVVENVIKSGIIKEVISIQQRNAARTYAANRVDLEEFRSDGAYNNEDFAKSSMRGSEFGKSSHSPSKSTRNSPLKLVADQPALPSALKKARVGDSESEDRSSP
jgi:hypothetical protein